MKNRRTPFLSCCLWKLCLYYMNRPWPPLFERKVTPPSTPTSPQVWRRWLFQTKQCSNWYATEPAESAWLLCFTTSQSPLKLEEQQIMFKSIRRSTIVHFPHWRNNNDHYRLLSVLKPCKTERIAFYWFKMELHLREKLNFQRNNKKLLKHSFY